MWQWLCTFAIVRIMPEALRTITTKTYFIFAAIFICAAPFVYFFIPETKGLSLEVSEVQNARAEPLLKPSNVCDRFVSVVYQQVI